METGAAVGLASAASLLVGGIGTLIYTGPASAWRSVFKTLQEEQVRQAKAIARLETLLGERDSTIRQRDEAIAERDGVIRRLRAYVEVLQGLLHRHHIEIPAPADPGDPFIAPERRTPVVTLPVTIDHAPTPD